MLWNKWLFQYFHKCKFSIHDSISIKWIIVELNPWICTAAHKFNLVKSSSMFQNALSFLIIQILRHIELILEGKEKFHWDYWYLDTYIYVTNGCKEICSGNRKFKISVIIIVCRIRLNELIRFLKLIYLYWNTLCWLHELVHIEIWKNRFFPKNYSIKLKLLRL